MEEIAPPPALDGTEPDDPRLDLALEAALGPDPPPGLPFPGGPDVDERLEQATDALLEEVRRVEEQACAAAARAERERRRRRRLLAGLGALALVAGALGLWGRSQRERAEAEKARAEAGWSLAEEEGARATTGWSLAHAESTRADEGWAAAERERARADAEESRAEAGWSLAEAEAARADEGWSRAEAEAARAATLARAEATRSLEVEVLAALRAAALRRGEGDFPASLEQLELAKGLLESDLATSELLALVLSKRAELERTVVEDQEARARAVRGADAVARLDAALVRAEIDGTSDAARAELLAAAFFAAGFDPLAPDAASEVTALFATGRGPELADGLLAWARAEAGAGRSERCAELAARAVQVADGPTVRGAAAQALIAAGLPHAAAQHLEALCAQVPDSRGARELLAGARFAAGDAEGASVALREALTFGPLVPAEESALRGRLGRALRRTGDLEGSETELLRARALGPELAWVALELAATQLARGDAAAALASVRGVIP